jgi:hypothetical protein
MMRFVRRALAVALLLAGAAASAHRFHAGIVDLSFNARTGNSEVVHTYMAHDVEALLANLYGRQFDLQDADDQQVLREYIEARFWLSDAKQARLPLRWVGMTADAERVIVFQELEKTPLTQAYAIHDKVLVDFLPDQVNTVNLNENSTVRTFTFNRDRLAHPTR